MSNVNKYDLYVLKTILKYHTFANCTALHLYWDFFVQLHNICYWMLIPEENLELTSFIHKEYGKASPFTSGGWFGQGQSQAW